MIVAIHPDDYGPGDASSPRWAELLRRSGFEIRWVNVREANILDQLRGCSGLMWRHAHFGEMAQIASRLMPVVEREMGICVYPDRSTAWHYDDKIAQAMLFEVLGIPTPRTWVWFDRDASLEWMSSSAPMPLVAKLATGAGSENVCLVPERQFGAELIEALFGPGLPSLDEVSLGLLARLSRAYRTFRRTARYRQVHHGYALFQEFLPGNDFDTRVTVIGCRAFVFRRLNRPGDFRASGSGRIDYSRDAVDSKMIRLAFATSAKLESQSCAIDGLWRGGEPVVGEVSYTYVSKAVYECPGHWALSGTPDAGELKWVDGNMWPEDAQIEDFIARLSRGSPMYK